MSFGLQGAFSSLGSHCRKSVLRAFKNLSTKFARALSNVGVQGKVHFLSKTVLDSLISLLFGCWRAGKRGATTNGEEVL